MSGALYNVAKIVRPLGYLAAFATAFLIKSLYGLFIASVLIITSEIFWRYAKIAGEGVPSDEREEYISSLASKSAVESFLVASGIVAIGMSIATHMSLVTLEESLRRVLQGYYVAALVLIILYVVWYMYHARKTG